MKTIPSVKSVWSNKSIKERANCTVVSLAIATDSSYEDAKEFLAKVGRKNNQGFYAEETYNNHSVILGHKFTKVGSDFLSDFINDNPKGTFIAIKSGHAFVVKDGQVIDHTDRGIKTYITAFRVEPTTEPNSPIKFSEIRIARETRKANKITTKDRVAEDKVVFKELFVKAKKLNKKLYIVNTRTNAKTEVIKVMPTGLRLPDVMRKYKNLKTDEIFEKPTKVKFGFHNFKYGGYITEVV